MRHIRMLGLCLVAALAVGAYAVSSASALPEFGKCEAKAGGKYKDANCTEKAKKGQGAYEWKKGSELAPVKFSGKNVGSGGVLYGSINTCLSRDRLPDGGEAYTQRHIRVTREKCEEPYTWEEEGEKFTSNSGEVDHTSTVPVECESENNTGELNGSKSVRNISVVFRGCKLYGVNPCSNGPKEGEIAVNVLKGTLGYINKAEHKAGILLEPAAKHGEFAKFDCLGVLEIVVGVGNEKEGAFYTSSGCELGSCPGTTPKDEKDGGYDGIIAPMTPVNRTSSTFEQVFTANLEHEAPSNVPSKFEGKHIDLLENYEYAAEEPPYTSMWGAAAEEITNVNTTEEPGEIRRKADAYCSE